MLTAENIEVHLLQYLVHMESYSSDFNLLNGTLLEPEIVEH